MVRPLAFALSAILATTFALAARGACRPKPESELKVHLVPQELDQWCWAACAQMVMRFHGVEKSQCEQAKDMFGTEECPCDQCEVKDPDPKCNAGRFPDLTRYGFECKRTSKQALSWEALKKELSEG